MSHPTHLLLVALPLLAGCGCRDDGGGPHDGQPQGLVESRELHLRLPVPTSAVTFTVPAGEHRSPPLAIDLPTIAHAPLASVTVDVATTVAEADIQAQAPVPAGGVTLEARARIGPPGSEDTVCDAGVEHGPVALHLDETGGAKGVTPAELPVAEDSIDDLNEGGLVLCAEGDVPVDLSVQVDALTAWITLAVDCEAAAPASLPAHLEGTYTCENACEPGVPETGTVTIDIEQDGELARYTDDGGAEYEGVVCGGDFHFLGGAGAPLGSDYVESGVLHIAADGATATKVSTWVSGWCGGVCQDQLTAVD